MKEKLKASKKCALCLEQKHLITNTHYLTDGVIRSCLNQEGVKYRDKGLYFHLPNSGVPFSSFNFQSATSLEKIEEILGRAPTEEEIKLAEEIIPFSVNDVFCQDCEDIFSSIENPFSQKILPKLRDSELKGISKIEYHKVTLIRLFFLMQILRTSICDDNFRLSAKCQDQLRIIILNNFKANISVATSFPLLITYLKTSGPKEAYTSNSVGVLTGENPSVIFMNDFLIQFYEDASSVEYFHGYGANDPQSFSEFLNVNEKKFIMKVLSNEERLTFWETVNLEGGGVLDSIMNYFSIFRGTWKAATGELPSEELQVEFIIKLTNYKDLPLADRLREGRIYRFTAGFIYEKLQKLF